MSLQSKIIRLTGPLGGFGFGRFLTRKTPKILMYHRFSKEPKPGFIDESCFYKQAKYIKDHFKAITMHEATSAVYDNQRIENAVVITVDDGYKDFYTIAAPILKEFNLPATLFVTTRFIDGDFWLWPDLVRYILDRSTKVNIDQFKSTFPQGTILDAAKRERLWGEIIGYLLSISETEKWTWLNKFAAHQEVRVPQSPTKDFEACSWDNLIELHKQGIEIGAHTKHHPSLGQVHQADALDNEIIGSVEEIEKRLEVRPLSFCYPNGQPNDYNDTVKQRVALSKCTSAVTAYYDKKLWDDRFEVRRFTASHDWFQFAKSINGIEMLGALWRNQSNHF